MDSDSDRALARLADGAALVALEAVSAPGPSVLRPGLLPGLRRALRDYMAEHLKPAADVSCCNPGPVHVAEASLGPDDSLPVPAVPLYEGLLVTRGEDGTWKLEVASTGLCWFYRSQAHLLADLADRMKEV